MIARTFPLDNNGNNKRAHAIVEPTIRRRFAPEHRRTTMRTGTCANGEGMLGAGLRDRDVAALVDDQRGVAAQRRWGCEVGSAFSGVDVEPDAC